MLGEEVTFALDFQDIPGRRYVFLGTACHLADACRPCVYPRGSCQPGQLGEHQHGEAYGVLRPGEAAVARPVEVQKDIRIPPP